MTVLVRRQREALKNWGITLSLWDEAGKAYGNAKLANIFFTREVQRSFGDKGISAVAFEPGIVRSNFGVESHPFIKFAYHSVLKYLFTISPKKSARRMASLALGKAGEDFGAGETYRVYGKKFKVKFQDEDDTIAGKLWNTCEEWVKNYVERS